MNVRNTLCGSILGLLVLTVGNVSAHAASILAWGNNDYGQVSSAPTGTGFTAIASGGNTGYALTANGSIVAWGRNDGGQVSGAPKGFGYTAIAAGYFAGSALWVDGSITAWGVARRVIRKSDQS